MPRPHERYIQVESKNALLELLLSGTPFKKIYVASNAFRDPKTKKILNEALRQNVPIVRVPRRKLDRLARTSVCESVIGLKPAPKEVFLPDILTATHGAKNPLFVLILNEVHYAQNIGALLRTAYGSGVDAVITSKRRSLHMTDEVTRISMGASERVPIVQMNVFDAIKQLRDIGAKIIGVHMAGKAYHQASLKGDVALVLGSEDEGISTRILDRCDELISIPMQGGLDSLNVSAAGAIVMYEKRRQDGVK